jgi:hypothetical protein
MVIVDRSSDRLSRGFVDGPPVHPGPALFGGSERCCSTLDSHRSSNHSSAVRALVGDRLLFAAVELERCSELWGPLLSATWGALNHKPETKTWPSS